MLYFLMVPLFIVYDRIFRENEGGKNDKIRSSRQLSPIVIVTSVLPTFIIFFLTTLH